MGQLVRIFSAARSLAQPLIPPGCALCRVPVSTPHTLCAECWPKVTFLERGGCRSCGHPVMGAEDDPDPLCDSCVDDRPVWQRGCAALHYDGGGRQLVLGLKHGDRLETLPILGQWMARAGADLLADADLAVPIPLHWRRRLKRRGNQAAGLALAACRAAGRPEIYSPRCLIRPHATASQGGRDRAARKANVAGVFARGPAVGEMAGARVVLVDDVLTTGATLREAARVCLEAGARGVDILVLALVIREETFYIRGHEEDTSDETC